MNDTRKIVTHPGDVPAPKTLAKFCGQKNEWDLSAKRLGVIPDDCSSVTDENGRVVKLVLRGAHISDLPPLAGLTSLASLWLSVNEISDLSPLAGLTSLADLDLSENEITDLSPLAGLALLTRLALRGNKISDLSPLVAADWVDFTDRIVAR